METRLRIRFGGDGNHSVDHNADVHFEEELWCSDYKWQRSRDSRLEGHHLFGLPCH